MCVFVCLCVAFYRHHCSEACCSSVKINAFEMEGYRNNSEMTCTTTSRRKHLRIVWGALICMMCHKGKGFSSCLCFSLWILVSMCFSSPYFSHHSHMFFSSIRTLCCIVVNPDNLYLIFQVLYMGLSLQAFSIILLFTKQILTDQSMVTFLSVCQLCAKRNCKDMKCKVPY